MSEDERPLVTVVTPSRNYGRFIADCLASVRDQDYPRIEHLVLDACSTDDTEAVIDSFRGSYLLEAFFEADAGQADALNRGFARANGEILCWLNADDFWLHDHVVSDAVAALEGGADLVTGTGWYVDAEGQRLESFTDAVRGECSPAQLIRELRSYDGLLQPATFWRRDIHRPLREDLHYTFDWRLFLDMQAAGATFEVVYGSWAGYRLHDTNKTSGDPSQRRAEVASLLREEWGWWSPQHLWALGVYAGYRTAESLRWSGLKRAVRKSNVAMARMTGNRMFSC